MVWTAVIAMEKVVNIGKNAFVPERKENALFAMLYSKGNTAVSDN